MTRTERYQRALAMTNRIYELKDAHGWSQHETDIAVSLMDEQVPMTLHSVGEYSVIDYLFLIYPFCPGLQAFEPVFMLQASPSLIARYGKLIASRGILGCYLQTVIQKESEIVVTLMSFSRN